MGRLDKDRQTKLEPQRINFAVSQLNKLGIEITNRNLNSIEFYWKGSKVVFYPFSGWHTGKTINDGRGIENLLKQLKA